MADTKETKRQIEALLKGGNISPTEELLAKIVLLQEEMSKRIDKLEQRQDLAQFADDLVNALRSETAERAISYDRHAMLLDLAGILEGVRTRHCGKGED